MSSNRKAKRAAAAAAAASSSSPYSQPEMLSSQTNVASSTAKLDVSPSTVTPNLPPASSSTTSSSTSSSTSSALSSSSSSSSSSSDTATTASGNRFNALFRACLSMNFRFGNLAITECDARYHLVRFCSWCGFEHGHPRQLVACTICYSAFYCNARCQRAASPHHRHYCTNLQRTTALTHTTSPSHERVHDKWSLPSIDDVVTVFGPTYDIRTIPYNPVNTAVIHFKRSDYEAAALDFYDEQFFNVRPYALRDEDVNSIDDDEWRTARVDAILRPEKACPYKYFCNYNQLFDLITQEYVKTLADYIGERAKILPQLKLKKLADASTSSSSQGERKFRVVEVGAGSGRLSYFLSRYLAPHVEIICTDNHEWALTERTLTTGASHPSSSRVEIVPLDFRQAVSQLSPDLVLVSWIPQYHDWTDVFRAAPSVMEYIVIAPHATGDSGHIWKTYGAPSRNDDTGEVVDTVPIYEKDGFMRFDLHQLNRIQYSCNDRPTEMFTSSTVSFRRKLGVEGEEMPPELKHPQFAFGPTIPCKCMTGGK